MLHGRASGPESIEGDRPVDGVRFDAVARGFGSVVDRRATARALVGGAVGLLGLATRHNVAAKTKKK